MRLVASTVWALPFCTGTCNLTDSQYEFYSNFTAGRNRHRIPACPRHLVHESLARRGRRWGVARARDTVTGVSGTCDPVRGADRCIARGRSKRMPPSRCQLLRRTCRRRGVGGQGLMVRLSSALPALQRSRRHRCLPPPAAPVLERRRAWRGRRLASS